MKPLPKQLELARAEHLNLETYCSVHPMAAIRPFLKKRKILSGEDIKRLPSGSLVRLSGLMVLIHTPPTRSGKRVMFITLEDETGLIDLVAFPDIQRVGARILLTSEVITGEGILKRTGKDGISTSIVLRKLFKRWCGPFLLVAERIATSP